MSNCYFASIFYSIADVFYIINFICFVNISFNVICAFVICLLKYLLTYLLTYLNCRCMLPTSSPLNYNKLVALALKSMAVSLIKSPYNMPFGNVLSRLI